MRDYKCVDCGVIATTTARGSIPLRCAECRKANVRQRVREHRARTWSGPPTFTCVDCGTTGEGRSDRKRCDGCKAEYTRLYEREYYRENLAPPERTWTCVDCGVSGTQAPKGKARIRCDACKRKVKTERMRADVLPPTPCADCGVLVPRSGGARRRPFKRCPECNLKSKVGARRARTNAPGREYFPHREVFDRDGWRCHLCGEAVNPDLAYPDPRSASLDHVIPLAKDGLHTRDNSACAHLECNVRKHAKIIETMGV